MRHVRIQEQKKHLQTKYGIPSPPGSQDESELDQSLHADRGEQETNVPVPMGWPLPMLNIDIFL